MPVNILIALCVDLTILTALLAVGAGALLANQRYAHGSVVGALWLVSLFVCISVFSHTIITFPFTGQSLGVFAFFGGIVNIVATVAGLVLASRGYVLAMRGKLK